MEDVLFLSIDTYLVFLPSFTEFYRVLPSFTEFYNAYNSGSTGFLKWISQWKMLWPFPVWCSRSTERSISFDRNLIRKSKANISNPSTTTRKKKESLSILQTKKERREKQLSISSNKKSLHGQYVPYAIGNKNPRNNRSTIIEFDASAVCASVFGKMRPKHYHEKNVQKCEINQSYYKEQYKWWKKKSNSINWPGGVIDF